MTPFLWAFCLSTGLIQKPLKGFTEQKTGGAHSSQSLALAGSCVIFGSAGFL